jgi:large subunit ribosomal protein L15
MAITLSTIKPAPGARHRSKRLGCGEGSGHGGSGSTRGMKGQRSRSGEGVRPGFEGGQMPLMRRIPKRGFSNVRFSSRMQEVRLSEILRLTPADVSTVDLALLKRLGLIGSLKHPVKVIGGTVAVNRALTVSAHACSKSVAEALSKAGGKYVQLDR